MQIKCYRLKLLIHLVNFLLHVVFCFLFVSEKPKRFIDIIIRDAAFSRQKLVKKLKAHFHFFVCSFKIKQP